MRTATSAHSPVAWESGHPHPSYYPQKLSYTPLAYQPRIPAPAGQSIPQQTPPSVCYNNYPQSQTPSDRTRRDAKAASPNYFNFAVGPTTHNENNDGLVRNDSGRSFEQRANGSVPLSRGSPSAVAQPTQTTPVDQRPEFAAFKRKSESSTNLHLGSLPPVNVEKSKVERFGDTSRPVTPAHGTVSGTGSLHKPDQSKESSPESDRVVRSPKRILSDDAAADERPRRNSPAGFVDGEEREDAEATMFLHQTDKPKQSLSPSASTLSGKRFDSGSQDSEAKGALTAGPTMVDPQFVAGLLSSETETVLLLDIRVSTQYVKSRIDGALSLCIPTTLLKRPSFDTKKVAEIFKDEKQKQHFENWRNCRYIVVYDAHSLQLKDALTCVQTLKKFQNEGWKGKSLVIRGGFDEFASVFPRHVAKGVSSVTASTEASSKGSLTVSLSSSCPSVAPAVGGCALPPSENAANPFFGNIRQNMDLIDGVGQLKAHLPSALTKDMEARLPTWLKEIATATDDGYSLSKKFLEIEKREQRRMQQALSGEVAYGTPKERGECVKLVQIAGIEKGSKNRYNNIWPYEHSRVKLEGKPMNGCDYVNANYVQSTISAKKYIATQCPVPDTFADFWSMIWHEDICTIVMLTAEKEGGHIKAHNYWKSEQYGQVNVTLLSENRPAAGGQVFTQGFDFVSGKDKNSGQIGVAASKSASGPTPLSSASLLASSSSNSSNESHDVDAPVVVIRKFAISKTDEPFATMREITQLQYTNWPDFGALAKPAHLLDMVEQVNTAIDGDANVSRINMKKSHGPSQSNETFKHSGGDDKIHVRPIVVHCSAGCGRTGTFCTVDTVIDALKKQRQLMQKQKEKEEKSKSLEQNQARERTPMEIDQEDDVSTFDESSGSTSPGRAGERISNEAKRAHLLRRDNIDLVEKTVEEFRNQRLSMVQCLRQYVFCYEAVLEWVVRHVDC